jgi:S-formylglutathione hydrolase
MRLTTKSRIGSHGGTQGVYSHASEVTACDMTFAVFVPPQAKDELRPVLWYLSGLTCTHANVMEKGEYRRLAAELGLIVVCPDTSPRGETVPDETDNWQFGSGAGFYVDATEEPYARNYQMHSYVVEELPALIAREFPADVTRQAIFGHSMGGHGALTIALTHPERFKSCSALAPIVHPMAAGWSTPAFQKYLGADEVSWRTYDAVALIEDGKRFTEFLVDQGTADGFLEDGLRPWLLDEACRKAGIRLTLRMQEGYDHSYFFISTFMDDHLRWHAERLGIQTRIRDPDLRKSGAAAISGKPIAQFSR